MKCFRIVSRCAAVGVALSCVFSVALAGKTTPRPVDETGRAQYVVAILDDVDDAMWDELTHLGFVLERNPDGHAMSWLSVDEMAKLATLGISWTAIPDPATSDRGDGGIDMTYHDYPALTTSLQQIAADHPNITRLVSIGQSAQGRELWMMKITDNPDVEEDEPGFKYVATMHGDEPIGTEMCLYLIDWLTDGYGSNSRATTLVDDLEIWILPLMNPDGNLLSQRFSATGVDLNRDFPDKWDDPNNVSTGRAAETQAMMQWQTQHSTSLSANFHTGAVVANYPYDNTPTGSSVYSATPDDDICIDLALEYSEDNSPMFNNPAFPQGITNGADWYAVSGGMQDWNYVYEGDIELTIELNNVKWPAASQLAGLWDDNRESMISYMERALTGVRGVVTDATSGSPLLATLTIVGRDVPFYTDPEIGDYQRALPAGSFDLQVSAPGYQQQTLPFSISDPKAAAVRVDVALQPLGTSFDVVGHRVDSDTGADGWLDPSETGQLAVSLQNMGAGATGISGRLVPLTPHAASANAASWPDMTPGQESESDAPHLDVDVSASTPAGHQLGFVVDWTTGEGLSGTSEAFFVPVGAPSIDQTPSPDVPKPVNDNVTVTSQTVIANDLEISDVNVQVDITHSYKGDLTVTLVGPAPDNHEVRLHDRTGGSTNDINTWFDRETPSVDDLSIFDGTSSAGTWTLRILDNANGDTGTLNSWTLELVTRAHEDPVAAVLFRGLAKDGANVDLNWWPVGTATSYKVYRSSDPSSEGAFSDVTSEDASTSDTQFADSSASTPGTAVFWLISAVGHTGEGLWGHFGR